MLYDKNGNHQKCLVPTSGDMSKNGMGDTNTIYLFKQEHLVDVNEFLRCQLEFNLATFMYPLDLGNKYCYSKVSKYFDAFDKLLKLKVFTCKYDSRTQWNMEMYNEETIIQEYGPSKVDDNLNILRDRKKSYAIMRTSKESILNWFDERGEFEVKILRHKIIYNPFKKQSWLFVRTDWDNGEDVELYCMNSEIAECYVGWDASDFDWKKEALIDCIPED